jgi:cell division initiation protein
MSDLHTNEFPTQHLSRPAVAADEIRERTFPVAVRGYDRQAVDAFVEEMAQLVGELESLQSRESVIQRALDQVGEETAGILQRAHEAGDEIAARSRAQAEGRISRAEREAEITRREADSYSEQVIVDTRLLWEERKRLIEDIRQLADEVLATADDAIERVKLPEPLLEREAGPEEPAESPTAEVELDLLPGGAGEPGAEPSEYEEQPLAEELPEDAVGASPSEEAPPADDAPEAEPEDEPRGEHASRGAGAPPGPPVPGTQPQTPAGGAPQAGLSPPEAAGEPSLYDTRKPTPGNGQ